jgi:hypothetical protein
LPEKNALTFRENVHFGVNFDPKMAAKLPKMRIFEKFKQAASCEG